MPKVDYKKVELNSKLLNGKAVPYPCEGCEEICKGEHYKKCKKWRKWFHVKFKEVKDRLKGVR